MEILSSTLNHIAVLFSFILIGFVLKKKNILSDGSGRTLSRLENGIFMPAVVINTLYGGKYKPKMDFPCLQHCAFDCCGCACFYYLKISYQRRVFA